MSEEKKIAWYQTRAAFGALTATVALGAAGVIALFLNVSERKEEGKQSFIPLVKVTEDDTDPAKWEKTGPSSMVSTRRRLFERRLVSGGTRAARRCPRRRLSATLG